LTRISIALHEGFYEGMDGRVKPGNDEVAEHEHRP